MLKIDKKNGYGASSGRLQYISPWSKDMASRGSMRFFSGETFRVVEVSLDEDGTLRVLTYPHNPENVIIEVNKLEKELRELYAQMKVLRPDEKYFPVSIYYGIDPVPVEDEEFTDYYPSATVEDEMFIFKNDRTSKYTYWVMEKSYRRSNPEILSVLASISHDVLDCATSPNDMGKELCYILALSKRSRSFQTGIPHVYSMHFPTKDTAELPSYLKTSELMKFVDASGAELITSKTVIDDTIPSLIEVDDIDDEELFGKPSVKSLLLAIQKQVLDKLSANLSDVFQVGLGKVIASLPINDQIIEIVPDVQGVGRRMCIYEGLFHIIPIKDSPEEVQVMFQFFGEPEELFKVCNEDTYPRKNTSIVPVSKSYLH